MFEWIYEYVEREDLIRYLRLLIVVGFYVLVRQYYTTWAKNKQIKRQIELDEQEKKERPEKEKKEMLEEKSKLEEQAKTFGWGKKTRKNVKLLEQKLEQATQELRLRHQTAYDAAEDHDIEDLLED